MSTSQPSGRTPKRKKRVDKLIGQRLADKYRILKKIGEGGMGSVYTATQEPIDRKVAVKVLLSKLAEDEVAVKRFEQEARAISKMQHPNTVTIYDFGHTAETDDEDERLYLVMEYLKGRTLTQLLRQEKVLAPSRACRIVRQVCASLADAHAAGIIHRDLKPDNIFLTEVGGDRDWVKVLDFGVAKLADSEGAGTLTQTGMIFGTPKYMSPEQAEGRPIDYRADIYAIGVVLYELLTGRPPFVADTPVGLLLKHISEPPKSFKEMRPDLDIDPRLESIVMKSLEKQPDARHQMVAELASDLGAFERLVSGPVPVVPSGMVHTPMPGMPTEVGIDNRSGPTPSNLRPPNEAPTGLSAGLEPGTEAHQAGAPSLGYAPADHLATAAQAPQGASAQFTSPGLTHPTPAPGGAYETLGGEISGPLPGARRKQQSNNSKLVVVGVGLIAVAGVLVFVATQGMPGSTAEPLSGRAVETTEVVQPIDPKPAEVARVEEPTTPPPAKPVEEPPPPRRAIKPRTTRPAAAEPPPPPPVVSRLVTVNFKSDPPGAKVMQNGKEVGITPFFASFPKGDDILSFVFEKPGYETQRKVATSRADTTVKVSLTEKAVAEVAPPPPPKPRPVKKPTKKPTKKKPDATKVDPTNDRVGDLKF